MSDAVKAFVRRQIEFYFGDANLPNDKFMREKANEDDEKPGEGQGWVELGLLCTFARMRQKQGEMEQADFVKCVGAALDGSAVVEVSEDGQRVRRLKPLPDTGEEELLRRSFYAKGFPRNGASLDDIMAFFEGSEIGKVEAVRMRYTGDKTRTFKGSVFVLMSTEAEATEVLSKSLIFEGTTLVLRPKAEYLEEKRKEFEERRARAEKRKQAPGEGEEGAEQPPAPREHAKGTTLKLEGCGETASRETLKDAFSPYGRIAWTLYERGEPSGYMFFKEEGKASEVIEKLFVEGAVPEVGGKQPTLSAVEGEEEAALWAKVWEMQDAMAARRHSGGGKRHKSR